jgi:enoyl-CoA hydratase
MSMQTLLVEKRDRMLWVRLNRPEARNAIDRAMNEELWQTWHDFANDDETAVAIITGSGQEAFCAGADLRDYIPRWLDAGMQEIRGNVGSGLGGITRGQHRIYKPIIAAVNRAAFAGGFELALACDIRIATHGSHCIALRHREASWHEAGRRWLAARHQDAPRRARTGGPPR